MTALTGSLLSSFEVAKVFKDTKRHINNLEFTPNGDHLLSSDDEMVNIYTVTTGKKSWSNPIKNDVIKWIGNDILIASHDELRIYDINNHANRRFKDGHSQKVISMDVHGDDFITSSLDNTVKLWVRSACTPVGSVMVPFNEQRGPPICCFDPDGKIFVVMTSGTFVRMYDIRKFNMPFQTTTVDIAGILSNPQVVSDPHNVFTTSMQFDPSGKHILVNTNLEAFCSVDGIYAKRIDYIYGNRICSGTRVSVGFTPDCNFVYSGNYDGGVTFYNANTTARVAILNPYGEGGLEDGQSGSNLVAFNPRYCMFASGTTELGFWIPKED